MCTVLITDSLFIGTSRVRPRRLVEHPGSWGSSLAVRWARADSVLEPGADRAAVPPIAHGQGASRRGGCGGTPNGRFRRLCVHAHRLRHPGGLLAAGRRTDAPVVAAAGSDPGALPDTTEPLARAA